MEEVCKEALRRSLFVKRMIYDNIMSMCRMPIGTPLGSKMRPSQARNIAKCTETPNLIVPRFVNLAIHMGSHTNRVKLVKGSKGQ